MIKKCQWCGVELKNDGEYGTMVYYTLPNYVKVDGLYNNKPICPLCASQFKIKHVADKIPILAT